VWLCLTEALAGRRAWWVAPTYPIAEIGWRALKHCSKQVPMATVHEVDRRVDFASGGWVQVRSADNPDSLRGEGLDFVVLDEAAYMKEEAWTEALRPALADRQGRALFISTPAGLNWFHTLWQRGQDGGSEWHSWKVPTSSNPYIPATEIEAARDGLPERTFAQEFLAEFISDAGAVFRRISEAAVGLPTEPVDKHSYVFGCDWGKSNDFTVFSVIDATAKQQVWQDRSNRIDYTLQAGRLRALAARYHPAAIIAETNAMGSTVIEMLRGLPILAWTASAATKAAMVEALAVAFEQGTLKILRDATLVGELQCYEAKRLPSGLMSYGGPDGGHDDTVIALGLAWLGARGNRRAGQIDFEQVA
jgi:phage terminase large subunit-like protein